MTPLGDPKRLAALLGQLDAAEETVRAMALSRVRDHLKRHGQSFVDLAAHVVRDPEPATPPPPPTRPSRPLTEEEAEERAFRERKARLRASADVGPHLHEPVGKRGLFSSRREDGKIVVAAHPAPGSVGRLRILKEKDDYGLVTLTCSLETKFEVFEPFKEKCMRGDAVHDQYVTLSRTGGNLRF